MASVGFPEYSIISTSATIANSGVRIEGNGALGLGGGLVILLFEQIGFAQYQVGEGQGVIQSNGLLLQLEGPIQGTRVIAPLKDPIQPIGAAKIRICGGIFGVQLDG